MSSGKINTDSMITNKFRFLDAAKAYELFNSDKPYLAILLEYDFEFSKKPNNIIKLKNSNYKKIIGAPTLGFIGAGNYARSTLIPAFKKSNVNLKTIASSGGASSLSCAKNLDLMKPQLI